MKNKDPHITIIILNWNGLQDTLECLESVSKNDYPNSSLIIIDNHSKEDELKKIKERIHSLKIKEPISYLQNHSNLGFAGGNNVGIRKAIKKRADYIFLLNNDTVVDPSFLSESIKSLQENGKKTGIVATTMVNYYDRTKLDNIGHDLLTTGDTVPRARNSKFEIRNSKLTAPPFGACAGAALYSSQMLKEIGLLDEDFFLNYEDSDLSLRGIVQGWKCVWAPKAIIYHKLNASIGKIKNSKYRIRSQRNQLWAYLHNTPLLVIILNSPWIILRDLLVILISFITFRWTITWIFIRSRIKVLKTLPKILKKRRKVMKNQKVSGWWYWKQQKSWLSTYWNYFKIIVLKKKPSVMERNG